MRIQSIRTAVEPGDPAGDRFFCSAREVPFREMDGVAETHHLAQKIRAMAKALENTGHLLAPRMRAPFVIHLRNLAGRVSILNDLDLCLRIRHGSVGQSLAQAALAGTLAIPPGDGRPYYA